jgi:SAM-dependent methyltransferase
LRIGKLFSRCKSGGATVFPEFVRKYISSQFGKPSGILGRMIEKRMSRRTTIDAEWTISLLNIQPKSRILEIGFGGGVSTQLASRQASQGFVAGIDHSTTMVGAARKRNADTIKAGRMELKQGDAASIPYPDESFDIVFSLHSIYFWNNPIECLKGFGRVLKPGGLLAITIQPKNRWRQEQTDAPGLTLFFGDQIIEMFSSAGFQNIRTESYTENGEINLQCILGNK